MKPSRRQFLGGVGAAALASSCPLGRGNDGSTTQLNVLHIMLDDCGYNDFSFNRWNPTNPYRVQTPVIDAFAQQGTRYTRHYCNALCTATRYGVLTGRPAHTQQYPPRTPGAHQADGVSHRMGLPLWSPTIMEVMKANGYATGHIGKWHVGGMQPDQFPWEHPNQRGVDEFWGIVNGSVDYYAKTDIKPDHLGEYRWEHNGVLTPETGYITNLIEYHAREFIVQHQAAPWYANVWLTAPHVPLQAPPISPRGSDWFGFYPVNIRNAIEPYHRQYYAAMLSYADEAIGGILAELDATGQADNTLVVITNDNGGNPIVADNAPWVGGKQEYTEGGLRTHCIVRLPGTFQAGAVDNSLVSHIDWFPTVLDLCGIPEDPAWPSILGRSLLKTMNEGDSDRVLTYQTINDGVPEFCEITRDTKLHTGRRPDGTDAAEWFWYDAEGGIDETNNLYGEVNPIRP